MSAQTAARFTRVFSLGATLLYPLAGVATGAAAAGVPELAWALAAGVLTHLHSHVGNDVADLPLDATDPRRAPDPLVRGTVRPEAALLLVVATAPLLFATLLPYDAAAARWLAAAVVLVGAYDVAGKSLRVPFVADLAQGAGCGAFVVAGAYVAGGPTAATWWAVAFAAAYDAMVNGVHGSVRDVVNDAARGAATTAALLGTRITGGAVRAGAPMLAYAATLHLATGVALGGFLAASPRAVLAGGAAAALYAAATAMLARTFRARGELRRAMAAATWHLFLLPAALVAALAARLGAAAWGVAAAAFVVPPVLFALAVRGTQFGVPSTTAPAALVAPPAPRRAKARAVFEMVRIGTPAVGAALVAVGAVLADGPVWRAVPAMVATALVVAAANVFNDRCDLVADEVNRPDRPLPSGAVTPNDCDRLVLAASLGVIAAAATVGVAALVATTALLAAALSYSLVLRRLAGANHLAVGLLFASPVVYGGWVASGTLRAEHWAAVVLVTLFVFARETLKAIPDRRGDIAAGRRTLATALGERAALRVYRGAAAAFCVAALAAYAVVDDLGYLGAVVALAVAPTILTLRRVRGAPPAAVVADAVAFSGNVFALGVVPLLLMG